MMVDLTHRDTHGESGRKRREGHIDKDRERQRIRRNIVAENISITCVNKLFL